MRVILTFEHCSPHQVAAVEAARRFFTQEGHVLIPVEHYSSLQEYGWSFADRPRSPDWRCLFPGRQSATTREIVRGVRRTVKELRGDVLVLNGWYGRDTWVLAALKNWMGCRLVLVSDTIRWDRPRSWWKEQTKRLLMRRCDAGFVAGQAQRDYLHELGVPLEKITLGNDVVDNSLYTSLPLRPLPDDRRIVIGTAARLIPEKNLATAVQAFAQVCADHPALGLEWQIAGRGPLEAEVRAEAAAAQIPVVFRGFVGYPDMPKWYAGLDIYWQPSINESWGLVVNEAMAAGLPVVVSDRCGCARDLVTEANGWTHAADASAMASAWKSVLAQRLTWPQRGAASRQLIAGWDLDRYARGLFDACRIARPD